MKKIVLSTAKQLCHRI